MGGFIRLYGIYTEKGMRKRPFSAFPGFGGFRPNYAARVDEHDALVLAEALAVGRSIVRLASAETGDHRDAYSGHVYELASIVHDFEERPDL